MKDTKANILFTEFEFERYIYELMQKSDMFRNIRLHEAISRNILIDIQAERAVNKKWEKLAIEIRNLTSFTIERIYRIVARMKEIQRLITDVKCVFLFPGKLSDEANKIFIEKLPKGKFCRWPII